MDVPLKIHYVRCVYCIIIYFYCKIWQVKTASRLLPVMETEPSENGVNALVGNYGYDLS